MIARTAIAAITTLLLTASALAAPALKGDITVTAAVVTVGDMFDEAGLAAEDALFRAPKPGTTGTVDLLDIKAAAARIGIETFETRGLDRIRVSRAATVIDQSALTRLIADDLKNRGILTEGMSANTIFTDMVPMLNAEAVDTPASITSLRYLPANGGFQARFAIAGIDQPLDLSGSIELMIDAPHLAGNYPGGTILDASDIVMRPVPLRYVESTGVARLQDIVGKALTRQSREGMMVKPADVSLPMTVAKNDLVTIYFRHGPMTLTVKGQAVTGATIGAPLQVLNLMSRRVISATAIAAGAVEVSSEPLALAGL
ncbi:flagellar basal body P-ring formation chaperone FlgA [Devosia neptuniae]|jgi:flagellar basal body P-ring formation protein FlgA|uniref:flagellar basal body P-ring formation chaperone FlgA n=1 Tax=Devosia neptuniae TaxID=191302 RepID=UPI0022AE5970|nr:flagellar basal body P-ring formation chaperone FlgA [Devosia neptuniae]MCZ4345889.1 flagellar basal body P-ring formation chaperone FlgA [Devosia neptuniae]|tara:strand:+ start:11580 stop:12524 length:945 start_codon:yes stop_codon:yes gene_type:complete